MTSILFLTKDYLRNQKYFLRSKYLKKKVFLDFIFHFQNSDWILNIFKQTWPSKLNINFKYFNFKYFFKKDDAHSWCLFELKDSEKGGEWKVWKVPF